MTSLYDSNRAATSKSGNRHGGREKDKEFEGNQRQHEFHVIAGVHAGRLARTMVVMPTSGRMQGNQAHVN